MILRESGFSDDGAACASLPGFLITSGMTGGIIKRFLIIFGMTGIFTERFLITFGMTGMAIRGTERCFTGGFATGKTPFPVLSRSASGLLSEGKHPGLSVLCHP
jgi:hypothetical protein